MIFFEVTNNRYIRIIYLTLMALSMGDVYCHGVHNLLFSYSSTRSLMFAMLVMF